MGNIANVARNLADGQQRLGHEPRVIAFAADGFKEEADEVMRGTGPIGWNLGMRRLQVNWHDLDAVHVHGGIWRSQLYYYVLRRVARRAAWVAHLHGSETRMRKGLHHLRLADAILVSTADLLRYMPSAEWLPNPVPAPDRIVPRRPAERVVFGHFPTNREIKGTGNIIEAFQAAFGEAQEITHPSPMVERRRWKEVELIIAEQIPHADVMRYMDGCDLVIDHLSALGPVSLVALEAMARGRPAVSSFDAQSYPPSCPVIPLKMGTADRSLRNLVAHPERLRESAEAGLRYVRDLHDPDRIARQTIEIYEKARARAA